MRRAAKEDEERCEKSARKIPSPKEGVNLLRKWYYRVRRFFCSHHGMDVTAEWSPDLICIMGICERCRTKVFHVHIPAEDFLKHPQKDRLH
jgi:hypothetical protein